MKPIMDEHGIITHRIWAKWGYSERKLQALVADGTLTKLSRGNYAPTHLIPEEPWKRDDELYRLRCLAEGDDAVVLAYQSAAAVHGLPLLNPDLTRVHTLNGLPSGSTIRERRHVHAGLYDDDLEMVDGVIVTSLVRTSVDIAAASSFAGALAVIDSALRLGATKEELLECALRRRRRGIGIVLKAIEYGDGLSANPGESWGRAQMIEAGLPVPDLQVRFDLPEGTAYTDYGWDRRLAGEFDGREKFGPTMRRPGQTADDVVLEEKDREDALRAADVMVVRWRWRHLVEHTMVARVEPWLRRFGFC